MAWESLKWASSRWSLSRWLLFARLLQLSGTLVTALMNGFLLVYIHNNGLGFASSMFCLEMMACIALIYSGLVLLMQHSGDRRRRSSTPLIATFIAGDVVFSVMMIAIITVLARTGLPTDCHGLTRDDMEPGDVEDKPPPGFNTMRFGDEAHNIKGQLDSYCSLERGFYFIAAALVFTYMLTVTLGVLRIYERHYINSRKDPLFASTDNVYQLDHIRSEIHNPNRTGDLENAAPSTEGILTPRSRANPSIQTQGFGSSDDLRRERAFRQQAQTQPLPVSPVSAASPVSQVSPVSPVVRQHGSFNSPVVLDTSMEGLMIGHSPDPDPAAEATITDGYRHHLHPGMSSLPPYSPGQSRGQFMDGHGDESNEMRLSEYVKGETRAQNMKDSGMGM
ncbi:hypothetical protein GGS26DRAFT_66131 [Hypomontagnella submonticulosa]|nr:hypothetical protein GGS26DRAFT_66131 [Hypomontagnella submonticulosa]